MSSSSKREPNEDEEECEVCAGTGTCTECDGTGECKVCGGIGCVKEGSQNE